MATHSKIGESTRSTTTTTTTDGGEEEEVAEEEEDEEEEEEKLEEEVKEMAKKLKEYRSKLPHHLKSSLSSLLESQRPPLSLSSDVSLPGPSSRPHLLPGSASCSENSNGDLAAGGGDRITDDIKLLHEKISSNISAMPKVLKRMSECISRIDRLASSNETIHPVFKRKKS